MRPAAKSARPKPRPVPESGTQPVSLAPFDGTLEGLPSGLVALCCPEVSTFESSKTRSNYFGFDPKTNLVQNSNADEYWVPPTKEKSLPASRTTRDGARWVSVGVGLETEVEISFDGHKGLGCITNCIYEVSPASIAEVMTKEITGNKVAFKIKGNAEGEASLKVICQEKVIGYFHIWCIRPVTIRANIASIVTPQARTASYSVSDMEAYINNIFRQSLITVKLKDAGAITVKPFLSRYLNDATPVALAHWNELDTLATLASSKLSEKYRLYYYIDKNGHNGNYGAVSRGLGMPGAAFTFFDHDTVGSYNTMAHELGHLLNLSHPADDFDQHEFPAFQLANMADNILNDDPWNLMGYEGTLPERAANRKSLRYLQWKKCNRS